LVCDRNIESAFRVEQLNSGSSAVETLTYALLVKAISDNKYFASNNPSDVSPNLSEGALLISESTSYPGTLLSK